MNIEFFIIDDDLSVLTAIKQLLQLEELPVKSFSKAADVLPLIGQNWPGVVLTDITMPSMSGMDLLNRLVEHDADIPVIMLTGHGDISIAVEAMRSGAYDFIEKPFSNDHLTEVLRRAADKRRLVLENRELRAQLMTPAESGPRILGLSEKIQQLKRMLATIRNVTADVLIRGETGVGKDLVARYLHHHSNRRDENFVAINCGAIPETMIESELFGFEAGAFTSAQKRRIGKLEYANGGTFFLDEIESMPMALQIKLLRVLEERKLEPLGSNKQISLDIRVIAAAKVDLRELVDQGSFRQDLYYRLNVLQLEIPSLRERKSDIPELFQHFSTLASIRFALDSPKLSVNQMQQLMHYDWPGNIRELRNVAERFVLMNGQLALDKQNITASESVSSLADAVNAYERQLLEASLIRYGGCLSEVQAALCLPRKTLYDKLKKYSLDKEFYKHNGLTAAGEPQG